MTIPLPAERLRPAEKGEDVPVGWEVEANFRELAQRAVTRGGPGTGWTAPTLVNSWTVSTTVGYLKDSLGFVHLKGVVQAPAAGVNSTVFTLPVGYRPGQAVEFAAKYWNGAVNTLGSVNVSTAGVVTAVSNTNGVPPVSTFFYFDGFTLLGEA